ncbi:MAG: glucose-1-phosphate cytidylyltransferase [Lachnospiraceae bacterium]
MKVVILAGGLGTRISEESYLLPKPMIEIGGKPIIWHIMKYYSSFGYNDFVICCGYKQHIIKEWFADYYLHNSDITLDFSDNNRMIIHNNFAEPWKVTLVDTGLNTMTGGRIKRVRQYIGNEKFMLTYGDGVSNVNIEDLVKHHESYGKIATVTVYNAGQRYGIVEMDEDGIIRRFREKNDIDGDLVNIGYMVLEPNIFDYISDDSTVFEKGPLEKVAEEGQLKAFLHNGFWQCMDTQREKQKLEKMIDENKAPWMVWRR